MRVDRALDNGSQRDQIDDGMAFRDGGHIDQKKLSILSDQIAGNKISMEKMLALQQCLQNGLDRLILPFADSLFQWFKLI